MVAALKKMLFAAQDKGTCIVNLDLKKSVNCGYFFLLVTHVKLTYDKH